MTINNKFVQCNLVLDKQIKRGDLKVIQKRSKLEQCNYRGATCTHLQKIQPTVTVT